MVSQIIRILQSVGYILPSSIPGLDFAGTIVETKLAHLKPGDRVHGRLDPPFFGTVADYVVVGKNGISKVPDTLSLRDASVAGIVALTAYQSIVPYVKAGDEVNEAQSSAFPAEHLQRFPPPPRVSWSGSLELPGKYTRRHASCTVTYHGSLLGCCRLPWSPHYRRSSRMHRLATDCRNSELVCQ